MGEAMSYLGNTITGRKGDIYRATPAQKGAIIYHQNDRAEFYFEVVTGVIRKTYLFADGRRQVTGFCFEGEVFGTDQGIYRTSAEVVSETARVRRFRWGDRAEDQRVLNTSAELLENSILLIGRRTALSRVAAFLADIRLRTEGSQWIPLPMPRVDIADYLGLSVETVSRTFSELIRKRYIAQPEHHRVQIVDQKRLAALAGAGTDAMPPGHARTKLPTNGNH